MHAKLPVLLLAAATALSGAVSCGGSSSNSQADSARSTMSQNSSATPSTPAHGDLRKLEELEQYVADQWNKAFADPADANYAEGVKVKTVKCVPKTGTTRSDCTVTPTKGDVKTWTYLVAEDGQSAERFSTGI
jgi:hypothetical protein